MSDFLSDKLSALDLPELLSREEMLQILIENEYGCVPKPSEISFKAQDDVIENFCAGKASIKKVTASCTINGSGFSFPFYAAIPASSGRHPFFVCINFSGNIPDLYMPTEELIDRGFAVLSFCYNDVTKDNDDFTDGLAGVLYKDGKRSPEGAGKIAMWAWAAQRVMDYAETQSDILDLDCAVICGHSRLGKTALFAAASDTRFAFAYSNNSGCSGAALSRGKVGETIENICGMFPYWFCENYKKYSRNEAAMPFDQHYLLACIAPRKVLVGSAADDEWADPNAEFLSCAAASPAFDRPFSCAPRLPQIDDMWFSGDIGYHLRDGLHYFCREDWQRLIRFVDLHRMV